MRLSLSAPSTACCRWTMRASNTASRLRLALPHPPVDPPSARRTFWFAVLIFIAVVGIEGYLLTTGFPVEMRHPELVGRLLGTLDAAMLAALYYIFGSSAGSVRLTHRHDDGQERTHEHHR